MREKAFWGAVEAGGTKFVCAVGTGLDDIRRPENRAVFPTGDDPAATLAAVAGWFKAREEQRGAPLAALGVASFGPVCLDKALPDYGRVMTTPKPGWSGFDLVGALGRTFPGRPIGFDTDVNGAALGEREWGAARGLDDFLYVTIGTGIGVGGMAGGRLLHGLTHPEMGHMGLRRLAGDVFPGVCPFHGDCWEGLCSGPAMAARSGTAAEDLPADHPVWEHEAAYVAEALATVTYALSPRRIILGGSVPKGGRLGEEGFFAKVRERFVATLGGYLPDERLTARVAEYIVPPGLGELAGVAGAWCLACAALGGREGETRPKP
ncbi:MAG TPA: ROK family protein [Solidesulfovibrio magneticus]|nr:ROK family protein [Solidesulfovibrio magneticus]